MRRGKGKPDDTKLRELILLISEWSQADPKFGAIKLNKLLFHSDFSAYLTFGVAITNQEYFALKQGPAPKRLLPITKKMKEREELAYRQIPYHGYIQRRPISLRRADTSVFSGREIDLVHRTIERFWNKSATEMSEKSHLFAGWEIAREKETIPYSTALVGRRPPKPEERKHGLALQSLAEKHLKHVHR